MIMVVVFLFSSNTAQANNNEEDITVLKGTSIPLYNENNEVVAFHYELNNGGYIIINSDGSDFIEYSLERSILDLEKDEKYYYNNPCSIYKKVNSSKKIKNCITDERAEVKDLEFNIKKVIVAMRKQLLLWQQI